MPNYIVNRLEVFIQPVRIEAADAEEAISLVAEGEGDDIEERLEYKQTLDPAMWEAYEEVT